MTGFISKEEPSRPAASPQAPFVPPARSGFAGQLTPRGFWKGERAGQAAMPDDQVKGAPAASDGVAKGKLSCAGESELLP